MSQALTLTHDQIEALWVQFGGRKGAADMAAAIAQAESGGNVGATNNNGDGSVDRGLFQINSVHGPMSTYDVAKNIKAAILISADGNNWRPWCTAWSDSACGSKGGTYLGAGAPFHQYIKGSYTPADIQYKVASDGSGVLTDSKGDNLANINAHTYDTGAGGNADPGLGPISWTAGLAKLLGALLDARFWLRIGQGLASAVLLLIGLGLVFRKDATALIPATRVTQEAMGG